jgi:hypothetical protein
VALKATLASVALAGAGVEVVLALWMYRRLPLAGSPPRPVRPAHRVLGVAVFALTVPVAVHCLVTYGVQLASPPVAVHSLAGCFFYSAFTAKVLLVHSRRLPGSMLPAAGAPSPSSLACCGTPPRCGTTTATSSPASSRAGCLPVRCRDIAPLPASAVARSAGAGRRFISVVAAS